MCGDDDNNNNETRDDDDAIDLYSQERERGREEERKRWEKMMINLTTKVLKIIKYFFFCIFQRF